MLGFDRFTLSCHRPSGREMILDPTFTTVSEDFLKEYDHFDWYESDAMAARIVAGEHSFAWNSQTDRFREVRQQSYIDFLKASQLSSGVMIALPRRAGAVSMIGMISFSDRQFTSDVMSAVAIIGHAAMGKAEMLGLCPEISADQAQAERSLSERQREILKWISEGKSNTDIAAIMGLSERAVRFHVSEMLKKLGVTSRSQASALFGLRPSPERRS